jgi:hypothetical protein
MSMLKTILKSLFENPEVAFATPASSTYSGYLAVPAEGIEWKPVRAFVDREVQTSTLGLKVAGLVGAQGGELKFRTGIPGLATAGASGVQAAPEPWFDELMQACGYTVTDDTGGAVANPATGVSTTNIPMTDSSGISVGSLVMINGEVRLVTANSANTLTVTPALTSAPAATDVVYGGANYHTSDSDPGTVTLVGKGDGYVFRFKGCKGSVALVDSAASKRPMLEWTFMVDSHDSSEPSGSVPSRVLSNHIPSVVGSPLFWGSTKTVSSAFSFAQTRDIKAKESTEGAQGRAGWLIVDEKPVAGFKPYYSSSYQTDFEALTTRSLLQQVGSTAQKTFAVYAHKAQITDGWQPGDVGGHVGHDVKVKVVDPAATGVSPYVWTVF